MKNFVNYLIALILYISRYILIIIPDIVRLKVGKLIGYFLILFSKERREITRQNLKNAYSDKTKKDIRKILIESYQNLGITLVELLVIDKYKDDQITKKVKFNNLDLINEYHKKGNGIILISGHFGNWELLAFAAGILSKKEINIIIKYQMNPYADKMLRNLRQRGGNKLIDMRKAGRKVVSILKNNGAIALLADQRADKENSLNMKFLGRETRVYKAPAALSLKFDTPIIIGFAVRDNKGNYSVDLKELPKSDLENNDEGIEILTRRYLDELENAINSNPGLWAWQHKRWKKD